MLKTNITTKLIPFLCLINGKINPDRPDINLLINACLGIDDKVLELP